MTPRPKIRPRPKSYPGKLVVKRRPREAGEFQFQDAAGAVCMVPGDIARIEMCCPLSGERVVIAPIGWRRPWRRPSWQASGPVAEPTLYPEIELPGGARVYLREGRFVSEGGVPHG